MSDDERSLYDDVTEYLLQPTLYAFAGSQRRLLLIGFHRRMASSIPALAASLENVAARLRGSMPAIARGSRHDDLRDLEDEDEVEEPPRTRRGPVDREAVAGELARVEDFVARAKSLPHDAKARSFQDAIRVILDLGRDGRGSGKAVVFTESITTQEYVRRLLLDIGLRDEDVTLFRGNNDHDRAKQAHARWLEEEGRNLPPGTRPTREVATRLALVHEFRTRSKVLVCTEAGAKGLNLQFCETVINYDLPWNPQRIEQRIGRCHRYSQQRDVTVVNFIAKDNEAHSLTFEILSQKLDLFGKVLDASDMVLHEPRTDAPELVVSAVSLEFETDLRNIYSRSRTLDEVTREIAALRDKIAGRRDAYEKEYDRTSQIIESRFDEDVRRSSGACATSCPQDWCSWIGTSPTWWTGTCARTASGYERTEQDGRVFFEVDADAPTACRIRRRAAIRHRGCARSLQRTAAQPAPSAGPGRDCGGPHLAGRVGRVCAPAGRQRRPDGAARKDRRARGCAGRLRRFRAGSAPGCRSGRRRRRHTRSLAGRPDRGTSGGRRRAVCRQPWTARWLDDAMDEAVFVDQRDVETARAGALRAGHGSARTVRRRQGAGLPPRACEHLGRSCASTRARRDEVVGSTARDRVEAEILRLAEKDEALERRISALDSREDEVYRKWRNEYHELRYRAPAVTRLFQVTFRIVPSKPETSC